MAKQGREKIVTTAFTLFLNKGYKKTSLNDIIVATNSSKGAIYHHFKSKHAIYLAALDEYFFKLYEDLLIEDSHETLINRIKNRYLFFVNLIDFVEKSGKGLSFPIRRYFLFQLESEEDETVRTKIIETLNAYHKEIEAIIHTSISKKEITITLSTSVIAQQLMSMIEGLAIHHSTLEKNSKEYLLKKFDEVIQPYINLLTNQN
ncbi:TetR/AcrR family transcriptional regulator [Tenacibaculum aiptasiae]|uniref:TetR/AcrR family transcriptional regulator n=1 Tax=Tenacibaculum aiptasiae TaxID=426481 RepID=A0A7J5AS90_9FLAO|nr:TetR/AcrR family transcriptional regulator [Tenacibaculum aiptasiae]KAB1160404.1 TetR/AcrR family transcriptional regulator [Tenacibaculum aiptasiae]